MSCSERFKLAAKAVLDRETEATEKVVKMSRSAVWEGKLAAWHDAQGSAIVVGFHLHSWVATYHYQDKHPIHKLLSLSSIRSHHCHHLVLCV
jgi:hypothetical protein